MTKEEAITILHNQAYKESNWVMTSDLEEATDMAIDALREYDEETEDVTIEPLPVDSNEFKSYTVREFLVAIQNKLLDGTIDMNTKVFSHIYTDDGFAYEYPQVCIDTVDGLDIDLDGRGLKDDILREHGMKWIKCSEKMPPFTEKVTDSEGDWEISDRVFVLCSDGGANINYWQHNITEATYSWNTKLDVVAWMPIPKYEEK